ncbi:MAG TPA: hypothetical protein VLG28_03620 [Acidimicrobiia bacterium]|nr:hypothetical protein [Acidimicrobiia bacterium]
MTAVSAVLRSSSRLLVVLVLLVAFGPVACGDAPDEATSQFQGFDGCQAGAGSVMAFLQRTLDQIGDAPLDEVAELVPEFDEGVHALLLRAQEVHCTEDGFNDAVRARAGELEASGITGQALIDVVSERGLGSLDAGRGGPILLPDN